MRKQLGPLELPSEREAEIVEEISEHMREAYADARERGVSEGEAHSYAESPFLPWKELRSNIGRAERTAGPEIEPRDRAVFDDDNSRWLGVGEMLGSIWLDLRYGVRTFLKRPFFTAVAVGTLGLGIGATTTMFSVVDGVLIRELPYNRSGELVTVWKTWLGRERVGSLRWREYEEIRNNGQAFQEVAVHRPERLIMTGSGEPTSLLVGVASASLFPMLGVQPQLGRFFQDGEDGVGALPLAVLSGELWQTRFGSNPGVIGQAITLDEVPYEVIGVMPAGFRLRNRGVNSEIETGVDTGERDVWVPVGFDGEDVQDWSMTLEFIGRVRPGVTLAQAHAEADALLQPVQEPSDMVVHLEFLNADQTGGLRPPPLLLLAAAGILSLVACANVANLLVSEAVGRRQEVRTRVAWVRPGSR